jgi:hypothetical protein
MRQVKTLKFENMFWILEYEEDGELVQEQFMTLEVARDRVERLGFPLAFPG